MRMRSLSQVRAHPEKYRGATAQVDVRISELRFE